MTYSVLYKFLRRQYALSFMETGELRVGSLYEYRRWEVHGSEIGDRGEGSKETICVDPIDSPEEVMAHPFLSHLIHASPGAKVNIHNASVTSKEESRDLYIYSMTESLLPEAAREMGYDSCILIRHPTAFLSSIDNALRLVADLQDGFHVQGCVYVSRTQLYSLEHGVMPALQHQAHPAVIKDTRYSYQREVRAIWEPKNPSIQPIILKCPQAIEYCELIEME